MEWFVCFQSLSELSESLAELLLDEPPSLSDSLPLSEPKRFSSEGGGVSPTDVENDWAVLLFGGNEFGGEDG